MDIRNFITFNTVADMTSFTKAAKALNYAQSTVTLHIKELEDHYHERLFDRIGKKISLTDFGRDLYQKTLRLEEDYHQVLRLKESGEPVRTFRIGGYESILKYRLYDLVKNFANLHPDVNLNIFYGTCDQLRQMIRDGELDVAFQLDNCTDFKGMVSMPVAEEKFCMILPPDKDLEAIKEDHTPVIYTEKVCSYRKVFEAYVNDQAIRPRSATETSSVDLIKQYVSYGLGFSMIPEITLLEEMTSDRLTILPFIPEKPLYSQIIYHKDKHIFPAMAHFIEMVTEMSADW